MAGITVRDASGNIILSPDDYYIRKIASMSVKITQQKTYVAYSGMAHNTHIVVPVLTTSMNLFWLITPVSIVDGGFWFYYSEGGYTGAYIQNMTFDIYSRV